MNDSFKMNSNKYSDNELHLMSYEELRRLSTLLRLPANIKKKYMISMIQAHQKGDVCTKIAIANKIMEERSVKRMGAKGKPVKPFLLGSSDTYQQIPTDLSVSTKHEFETRFSYVAHYTSKENTNSGISRIIKQEAEVSRRNRRVLQQSRKPTRKLSGVGRTEIMLPRNHSLTTPVRLMPQHERGFAPATSYEAIPGLSSKTHFQDSSSYNYHFHGEYSNALMPSSSHELYRNEPYWNTREVYNNSLMPILSSLLTPHTVTVNSPSYASQYASQKGPSSFQGVYEKYIKAGSVVESEAFETGIANSSTIIVNNHFTDDNDNNNNKNNHHHYNVSHGSYLVTKNDVDFEINSALDEITCQYNRRNNSVIRHSNDNQACLVDFYSPRNEELIASSKGVSHVTNGKDLSQFNGGYFRAEAKNVPQLSLSHGAFETNGVSAHRSTEMTQGENSNQVSAPTLGILSDYETSCTEEEKFLEAENSNRSSEDKSKVEKDNFMEGFLTVQNQGSFLSEVSDNSTGDSAEMNHTDLCDKGGSKENQIYLPPNFSRCRYILGHNKFPEVVNKSSETSTSLPSFLSAFCSSDLYNKAYSVCRNSFTGTTETHLNPIMTSSYAPQFDSHTNPQQNYAINAGNGPAIPRQWLYSYSEPQIPFSMESGTYATWDEYPDDMGSKIIAHSEHEVQVVKCRKHGCHYLYSISNTCD